MSIPVLLFFSLCFEACTFYGSKVVDAGYYACLCTNDELGEFDVHIDYYSWSIYEET